MMNRSVDGSQLSRLFAMDTGVRAWWPRSLDWMRKRSVGAGVNCRLGWPTCRKADSADGEPAANGPKKKQWAAGSPENLAQVGGLTYARCMGRPRWKPDTQFKELVLEPEWDDRFCAHCERFTYIYEHRDRRLLAKDDGPVHVVSKLAHCPDVDCPGHAEKIAPIAEMNLSPPHWTIDWKLFLWMGQRRFARSWSVPQIRSEMKDSFGIAVSSDLIEDYLKRYQTMVAARESDPVRLVDEYRKVKSLILTIDGLQPEKGHETLYVVRELRTQRIWFAIPLLSSAAEEIKRVFEQVAAWVKMLGKPVKLWISDKQQAFVTGIAEVFPGIPHRYCANHFLRDLAKPVVELDSHAKVQMRLKVRGLRDVERRILSERAPLEPAVRDTSPPLAEIAAPAQPPPTPPEDPASNTPPARMAVESGVEPSPETRAQANADVALAYAATIRGILNNDQGGPLDPPGLRMAGALQEVRGSMKRCVKRKKGGLARAI